jgi:hypothetical protein
VHGSFIKKFYALFYWNNWLSKKILCGMVTPSHNWFIIGIIMKLGNFKKRVIRSKMKRRNFPNNEKEQWNFTPKLTNEFVSLHRINSKNPKVITKIIK